MMRFKHALLVNEVKATFDSGIKVNYEIEEELIYKNQQGTEVVARFSGKHQISEIFNISKIKGQDPRQKVYVLPTDIENHVKGIKINLTEQVTIN